MVNKKSLTEDIKSLELKLKETEELVAKIKTTGSHYRIREMIEEFSEKKPKQDFISFRDLGDEADTDWIKKQETNAELLTKEEQDDTDK